MSERAPIALAKRRQLIRFTGATLLLSVTPLGRAALARASGILAVRVWPAADYTRVAIEHSEPLKFSHFTIKNPDRLVVDLEGVELNGVLEGMAGKIAADEARARDGRIVPISW